MAELKLYSYFRSSASYRVRIALNLKGLAYEYHAVHLLRNGGEQHVPEYAKLNPARQVPTLIHNGHAIAQSVAIFEYLEELFPNPALYPKNVLEKAWVRQFCENMNCAQVLQNTSTMNQAEKILAADEAKRSQWLKHWLTVNLETTEKMLQETKGPYCFGSQVTAADCFFYPQFLSSIRFGANPANFQRVSEIAKNLESHEAFVKAHPTRQPDTPDELRA